jgi:hypothetical protein
MRHPTCIWDDLPHRSFAAIVLPSSIEAYIPPNGLIEKLSECVADFVPLHMDRPVIELSYNKVSR